MARLTDMVNDDLELDESEMDSNVLVEALETLIEMAKDEALSEDDLELLDSTIEFIAEDFDDEDIFEESDEDYDFEEDDEELSEAKFLNKMTSKQKKLAKRTRMKNRAKLKRQAKKRKMKLKKFSNARKKCAVRIAGKEGYACNAKGKPYLKKKRK